MSRRTSKKIYKTTILFITLDVIVALCFFIMYGPWPKIRNLYVNTSLKTMSHQYLANVFYSEEKINEIMSQNYFIELQEETNTNDIIIDTKEKSSYKDKYEEELFTRDNPDDLYKIINLRVGTSNGYLVAIYAPEKVRLISTEKFNVGGKGERVSTMCNRYGGIVCINGGGFEDFGYGSDIPQGMVIQGGEITWGDENTPGNVIGLTEDGILKLIPNTTSKEALNAGVYDGMVFGPFLIINGNPLEIHGDPWGQAPRVAIGQRKDGVILFLVVDGENYINGASLQDMVDIMLRYGAYNAANLDGGQSSSLTINGKLYNNPPAAAKRQGGRYVVTGWGLIP